MGIDYDARLLSQKILIVFFIISTIIVNAVYLLRYFRAPGVFFRPGHFGKITLALGSIFMALFSYVVIAITVFEGTMDLSCRSIVTAAVYEFYFLPFVFGTSIVTMWLNMTSIQSRCNAKLLSLVMAAIPWLLALLLICPLALAGINMDTCIFDEDYEDRLWPLNMFSKLIPAITALVLSIVLFVIAMTRVSTEQLLRTPETEPHIDTTAAVPLDNISITMGNTSATKVTSGQTQQQPGIIGTRQSPLTFPQSEQTPAEYQQQYINPQQYPQQYINPQQYPQQYINPQQYPQQYINPQQYPQQYNMYPQQYPQQPLYPSSNAQQAHPQNQQGTPMEEGASSHCLLPQQVLKEKRALLLASIIFFLSVVPLTCFHLNKRMMLNQGRYFDTSEIIMLDIFNWISFLYPVLVPIIWLGQVQI